MLKSKQRPYEGPSLAFQKEPQDGPIPVAAGHSELQSPEGTPEISTPDPRRGRWPAVSLMAVTLPCHPVLWRCSVGSVSLLLSNADAFVA